MKNVKQLSVKEWKHYEGIWVPRNKQRGLGFRNPCQNFKNRKIDIYWIEGYNGYLEETKKVTYVVDWGSIIIMGK